MTNIAETAMQFVNACDSGKGWQSCAQFCQENASFSAQCEQLADVDRVEGYCEWMQSLLEALPDGRYELKSFGVDEDRGNVTLFAVFHGTHTGTGGPIPPTGKSVAAHYVYAMEFGEGKISHLTKIWNDPWTMKQLGWD